MDAFPKQTIVSEPLQEFTKYYKKVRRTESIWPHNFVLSTVDSDVVTLTENLYSSPQNQPQARTVSLHTHDERGFYFCSNYDGPKSQQIEQNSNVAMVFAWETIQAQIRITGKAEKLSPEQSDFLFNRCQQCEKIYYLTCSQGKGHPFSQSTVVTDLAAYKKHRQDCQAKHSQEDLQRPASWGGWRISPQTLEIMDFAFANLNSRQS